MYDRGPEFGKQYAPKARRCTKEDAAHSLQLINRESPSGLVLPRSRIDWRKTIVYSEGSKIVGTISYKPWGDDWVEITSLVVDPQYRGNGIGKTLLTEMLSMLKKFGRRKIFCLTTVLPLFEDAGFVKIQIKKLPFKALKDCALCPLNKGDATMPNCHETPMELKQP